MNILSAHPDLLLGISVFFGLLLAFGIGANDVSNAMGTSVGSKAINIPTAVCIAAVFEFLGSFLAGAEVTQTIRSNLFDASIYESQPDTLLLGMLACLLASGSWLLLASWKGWPVSTTHSILGTITGFVCLTAGPSAVQWSMIRKIFYSWMISPLISGVLAYTIFFLSQRFVLQKKDPLFYAKRYGPVYFFFTSSMILYVTVLKGLERFGYPCSLSSRLLVIAVGGGVASWFGKRLFALWTEKRDTQPTASSFASIHSPVERIFAILMVNTACSMAFSHGSNDVANAIGPLAVIASLIQTGTVAAQAPISNWILLVGGLGIVLGLSFLGSLQVEGLLQSSQPHSLS